MTQNNENELLPSLTELFTYRQGDDTKPAKVIGVSLGVSHSAVITEEGRVFTAGLGTEGQLGTYIDEGVENSILMQRIKGDETSRFQDSARKSNTYNYEEENELERYCYLYKIPKFGPHNKAIGVSCGDNYTIVLNDKNQVYSFGKPSYYRLGQGEISKDENIYEPTLMESLKNEKIVDISAGCRHGACINGKGEIFCWGFNFYDQLGLGDSERDYSKPTKVAKLEGHFARMVSCGYFHSGAILDN